MNETILISLIILIILIKLIRSIGQKNNVPTQSVEYTEQTEQVEYLYKRLDVLFTPAERSFLGVLNQVVNSKVQVFGKVRVADVLTPQEGMSRSEWQKAFNKISAKHFDFVLCALDDLSILCAIELNDRSHSSKKRKQRDIFLENTCQSASFPLIQFTAKAAYEISAIEEVLAPYLPNETSVDSAFKPPELPPQSAEHQSTSYEKVCIRCSSKMSKKIAKKGKNIGSEFWSCSNFPKCRFSESINNGDSAGINTPH